MTALRAIPGGSAPSLPRTAAQAWRRALRAVEFWDDAVYRAHVAVIESEPGQLLAAVDRWRAAEERLEAALLRERRARLEATGRRWLASVGGAP